MKVFEDMKTNKIFIAFFFALCALPVAAQVGGDDLQYRRSSLYSVMINHTDQKFANEIREAFLEIPVPDRFNNHDLSVKVLDMDERLKKAGSSKENAVISEFIKEIDTERGVFIRTIPGFFD